MKSFHQFFNESTLIENAIHRVKVTYSDPQFKDSNITHKVYRIGSESGLSKNDAVIKARIHVGKRGYKIHSAKHVGFYDHVSGENN